jgi:hypothetical protein
MPGPRVDWDLVLPRGIRNAHSCQMVLMGRCGRTTRSALTDDQGWGRRGNRRRRVLRQLHRRRSGLGGVDRPHTRSQRAHHYSAGVGLPPGESFIERMNEALGEAERVLAVASPAYFRSAYARREWAAALALAGGEFGQLLLVRIAPVELPPLLTDLIYLDLVGLDQAAATRRLLTGVTPGRTRPVDRPTFPGARFPGGAPAVLGIPPRNPNFTGRERPPLHCRQPPQPRSGAVGPRRAVRRPRSC